MNNLTQKLMTILNTNNIYIINILYTLVVVILLNIIFKIIKSINLRRITSEKQLFLIQKRNKAIFTLILIIAILFIWKNEFKDIITLISFISAALTLAIREIIYNYVCGIYIKISKPIKIEDRIQLEEVIGDVVNINSLSFELLEVNQETNQSTGKIIHIPNSQIFSKETINYTTAFKYIWDEINVSVDLTTDIKKAKKILLKLLENNEIIKEIPKKMKNEIKSSRSEYRIYYNKLEPIIYTKIEENKIILTARFLIHPKKQRTVESEIYENLLQEFKKNNIVII